MDLFCNIYTFNMFGNFLSHLESVQTIRKLSRPSSTSDNLDSFYTKWNVFWMFDFIVTKTSETRKNFPAGNFTWIFSVSADPPTCNWKTIFGPFPNGCSGGWRRRCSSGGKKWNWSVRGNSPVRAETLQYPVLGNPPQSWHPPLSSPIPSLANPACQKEQPGPNQTKPYIPIWLIGSNFTPILRSQIVSTSEAELKQAVQSVVQQQLETLPLSSSKTSEKAACSVVDHLWLQAAGPESLDKS